MSPTQTPLLPRLLTGTALFLAIAAVCIAIFAEVLLYTPLHERFYLASAVLIALPWAGARFASGPGAAGGTTPLLAVALVALAALHLVPWSSRKPFLQQLWQIEPGMTLAQVEQIMAGFLRGSGVRTATGPLVLSDGVIYRHSDDARFNRDWGIVRFEGDRVVSVEFSAD